MGVEKIILFYKSFDIDVPRDTTVPTSKYYVLYPRMNIGGIFYVEDLFEANKEL